MEELTRLTTIDLPKRVTVGLRFGHPLETQVTGHGTTHHWFEPGRVFAVVWWARVSPRKQWACLAVAESLHASETGYRLPCVIPAVKVHVWLANRCRGNDRGVVEQADAVIRNIEAQEIDPSDVPAAYYRAAGQSLRVRHQPRLLTREHLQNYWRIRLCP